MKVAIVLLAVVAAVASAPADGYGYGGHNAGYKKVDYYAVPYYKSEWAVEDDYYNKYGQQEKREGDYTEGNIWMDLPGKSYNKQDYYVKSYPISYEGYRYGGHAGYGSDNKGQYKGYDNNKKY